MLFLCEWSIPCQFTNTVQLEANSEANKQENLAMHFQKKQSKPRVEVSVGKSPDLFFFFITYFHIVVASMFWSSSARTPLATAPSGCKLKKVLVVELLVFMFKKKLRQGCQVHAKLPAQWYFKPHPRWKLTQF